MTEFPPSGRRWAWTDVVGDRDGKVDPKAAHAALPLIDRHEDDGTYEVTRRLEDYLAEQWSIECTGTVTAPEQSTLPGTTGTDGRARRRSDGGSSPRVTGQATLTGRTLRADAFEDQAGSDARTTFERVMETRAGEARARGDVPDSQTTLAEYTRPAYRVREPAGDVYSSPSPRTA
ncbi:hypothetical protein [Halostella pelagica]|uniref:hypothetical protein n=1 Tax=Halostella pelagica TaxID=2583824 RepID=UPI001080F7A8|nr:hypothetical protein [Halostella pelagica]